MKTLTFLFLTIALSLSLNACADLEYYSQSIQGHLSIMLKRQPIDDVLADPDKSETLKERLKLILNVREFAENELSMPENMSFRTYAEIDQPYPVWNVVAAPAYSLAASEWCFPVAGCLPYRGYYEKVAAESFADSLRAKGFDTYVYGVPAYSTLGWFDDPVLSSFVNYPDWALAGLIFHELAHQIVYIESDGDFNEAFASVVEQAGVVRWLSVYRSAENKEAYRQHKSRADQFYGLVSTARSQLLDCYDGRNDLSLDERQTCKQNTFKLMRQHYADLRQSRSGSDTYDRWFEPGLNNARFISAHTYRYYIPAFAQLLRQQQGDMPAFYAAVKQLAKLPASDRKLALADLRKASIAAISNTSNASFESVKNLSSKSRI